MNNKKYLSRVAAISLAALTTVSAAAMPAFADVTATKPISGEMTASGTTTFVKWNLVYSQKTISATLPSTTVGQLGTPTTDESWRPLVGPIDGLHGSVKDVDGTDKPKWDLNNVSSLPASNTGTYYTTSALANAELTEMKNVVKWQNSNCHGTAILNSSSTVFGTTANTLDLYLAPKKSDGTPKDVYFSGGDEAKADWLTTLGNYVSYYNQYKAMQKKLTDDQAANAALATPATPGPQASDAKYDITVNGYIFTGDTIRSGASASDNILPKATPEEPTALSTATTFTYVKYDLQSEVSTVSIESLMSAGKIGIPQAKVAVGKFIVNDFVTSGNSLASTDYKFVTGGGSDTGTTGTGTVGTYNQPIPDDASYRYASSTSYKGNNGYWYTSIAAANLYGQGYSGIHSASNYASGLQFFDPSSGLYYASNAYIYGYRVTDYIDTNTANVFYNSYTQRYYLTRADAEAASSSGTVTAYSRTSSNYFNTKNGYFYSSYADAVSATGSNTDVVTSSGAAINNNTNAMDPYYAYMSGLYGGGGSSASSSNKVPAGSASVSGTTASKYAGWDNIASYVKSRSSGSTVKLSMNQQTYVPSTVISAAKSKNVTLTLVNSNGSTWTIKPGSVTSAKDVDTSVTYNVKNVKSSLVNAAKKANPGTVSTAQIKVGSSGSLGMTAGVTVKLPAKRSGCTVKAYRLNGSKLVREATSKVQSNGAVTLNLDTAGSYLLVVID